MELAVNEENLALAIGSRGQNIRLASRLVGWELNIISSNEAEAKERVVEAEFQAKLMVNLSIANLSAGVISSEALLCESPAAFILSNRASSLIFKVFAKSFTVSPKTITSFF